LRVGLDYENNETSDQEQRLINDMKLFDATNGDDDGMRLNIFDLSDTDIENYATTHGLGLGADAFKKIVEDEKNQKRDEIETLISAANSCGEPDTQNDAKDELKNIIYRNTEGEKTGKDSGAIGFRDIQNFVEKWGLQGKIYDDIVKVFEPNYDKSL
jgi:hypothetical protein